VSLGGKRHQDKKFLPSLLEWSGKNNERDSKFASIPISSHVRMAFKRRNPTDFPHLVTRNKFLFLRVIYDLNGK